MVNINNFFQWLFLFLQKIGWNLGLGRRKTSLTFFWYKRSFVDLILIDLEMTMFYLLILEDEDGEDDSFSEQPMMSSGK